MCIHIHRHIWKHTDFVFSRFHWLISIIFWPITILLPFSTDVVRPLSSELFTKIDRIFSRFRPKMYLWYRKQIIHCLLSLWYRFRINKIFCRSLWTLSNSSNIFFHVSCSMPMTDIPQRRLSNRYAELGVPQWGQFPCGRQLIPNPA